jgi:hypothetical protein
MNVDLSFIINDTFVKYQTNSILYGKTIHDYHKWIIMNVIKYYSTIGHDNSSAYAETNIGLFVDSIFAENPAISYDEFKSKFKDTESEECLITYVLIPYHTRDNDLILRTAQTFGRVLPMKNITEWYDTYRLNAFGNVLNQLVWDNLNTDGVISVPYDPEPINTAVEIDYVAFVKYFVSSLREFMLINDLTRDKFQGETSAKLINGKSLKRIEDLKPLSEQEIENLKNSLKNHDLRNILNGLKKLEVITHRIENLENTLSQQNIKNLKKQSQQEIEDLQNNILPQQENEDLKTLKDIHKKLKNSKLLYYKIIADKAYEYFPFYYGGTHGCDIFRDNFCMSTRFAPSLSVIKQILLRYPSLSIGYIMNTSTYESGKGQHWVAIYFMQDNNGAKCKLICSEGGDFTGFEESSFSTTLKELGFGMEWNPTKIQMDDCNCGMYSFLSLYKLIEKKGNINEAIKSIGTNAENIIKGADIYTFRDKTTGVLK